MTDLVEVTGTVSTAGVTTPIVISGLVDAKGGWLRITPPSGTEEPWAEVNHCYYDTSGNSTGIEAFRNGVTLQCRHRDLVAASNTFWRRDTAGTVVINGYAVLTATSLTINFNNSVAGYTIEYMIYTGANVEALAFAQNGSPVTTTFEPNIVHFGGYAAVANGGDTKARFWTGIATAEPTIVQGAVTASFEDEETTSSELKWMISTATRGFNSTFLSVSPTSFTFDTHVGPAMGLAVKTGGSVGLKTFQIPGTAVDTDTVSMPNAGFDDVGLMISWAGTGDFDVNDTTRASLGIGIASKEAVSQRAYVAFHDSTDGLSEAEDGQFVKSMRADTSRVETRGTIDSVQRTPTLTLDTAPGVDLDVLVLYVQTKGAAVATRRSYAIIG
jgi:hypothetical protein